VGLFIGMASRIISIRVLTDNANAYATEPVSLADAKAYMQVEGTAYDDTITAFIVSARQKVEQYTNISLVPKSIRAVIRTLNYDAFSLPYFYPDEITSVAWRKCPSTLVTLTENSDWYNLNDGYIVSNTYKGEFTITYTTTADERDIFQQAIKSIVRFMYNAGLEDSPEIPKEIKFLLDSVSKRTL
jgi:hypothetical protein